MTCDEVRLRLSLHVYGELSFNEEEAVEAHLAGCKGCRVALERTKLMHEAWDEIVAAPEPTMLASSRRELMVRVAAARASKGRTARLAERLGLKWKLVSPIWQPLGAMALLLAGYFGARVGPLAPGRPDEASLAAPLASRVRYVEPEAAGRVRVVVEEARQRVLTGRPDDESIRRLLMAAARDPGDPGLRAESVNLLRGQLDSEDVRATLLYEVQHDPNAGVRLAALEGLKQFAGDPQMRRVLTQVLLSDRNPGVRSEVIDVLVEKRSDDVVGTLQELMHEEENQDVRDRCERVLASWKASAGTF
jgi:anti-sigma factor RsiW